MAGTYTQIHLHLVFAVKYRRALLGPTWRAQVFEYLSQTASNEGHKVLAVNGVADHVHMAIGLRPVQAIAELVQRLKQSSSRWINESQLAPGRFAWQEGYGAFSISPNHLSPLLTYIAEQSIHHQMRSFRDEYQSLLHLNGVEFDMRYVFQDLE